MPPNTAYIALGSNLGDRESTLSAAISHLKNQPPAILHVTKVSSFREYAAVGGPADSPPYINSAAEIQTTLSPTELLDALLAFELAWGRVRNVRWEPREIDLDLLLYGDEVIKSDRITVPHPRMHERRFVLEPLAEIAPDGVHPVLHKNIAALLEELDPSRMRKP